MFERIKAYLRNRRYERERKKFIRKWNEVIKIGASVDINAKRLNVQ